MHYRRLLVTSLVFYIWQLDTGLFHQLTIPKAMFYHTFAFIPTMLINPVHQ